MEHADKIRHADPVIMTSDFLFQNVFLFWRYKCFKLQASIPLYYIYLSIKWPCDLDLWPFNFQTFRELNSTWSAFLSLSGLPNLIDLG